MNLQKATILVIAALLINIAVKISNVIFPQIYEITFFTQLFLFLSIFRSIAILIFVIYFYREYITENNFILKQPAIFIIITTALLLLLQLRHVVHFFSKLQASIYEISPFIHGLLLERSVQQLSPFINWFYLLSLVYFIITFYFVIQNKAPINLLFATRWAIVGSIINLLVTTFSIIIFTFFGEKSWIPMVSQKYSLLMLSLILFASFTFLYFIWYFYKSLHVKVKESSLLNI